MDSQQQAWYEELYELVTGDYSEAVEAQLAVWENRLPQRQPLLLHCALSPEQAARFPDYNYGEIHQDRAKMLLQGMKGMLSAVVAGMQSVPSLRANMGCGIFPSLFPGIEPLLFEDWRMPWVVHHLTHDEIRGLREKDIKITDEFRIALDHMAYLSEKIAGTGSFVFPLDLQGPFDTAHIVYGDQFFYDLYDEPELIHHLLELSTYAIRLGLDECLKIIPNSDRLLAHYNDVVLPRGRGGIKVSEDTSTLVSAEHIDEFVIPYTRQVLAYAGGGYIHYCGKNDHLFKRMIEQELVRGLNFGNPEKQDMDDFLCRISQADKVYYGSVPMLEGETDVAFFKRVTASATVNGKCRLLLQYYASYEERDRIREAWREATAGNF